MESKYSEKHSLLKYGVWEHKNGVVSFAGFVMPKELYERLEKGRVDYERNYQKALVEIERLERIMIDNDLLETYTLKCNGCEAEKEFAKTYGRETVAFWCSCCA